MPDDPDVARKNPSSGSVLFGKESSLIETGKNGVFVFKHVRMRSTVSGFVGAKKIKRFFGVCAMRGEVFGRALF